MATKCNSFTDAKAFVTSWLNNNPNAIQLDGSRNKKSNPRCELVFQLPEIPGMSDVIVGIHGDTTIDQLKRFSASDIRDFIIVPPYGNHENWRLHFHDQHGYSRAKSADGLYAYVGQDL